MDDMEPPSSYHRDRREKIKVALFIGGLAIYFMLCMAGIIWALRKRYAGTGLSDWQMLVLNWPSFLQGLVVAVATTFLVDRLFRRTSKKYRDLVEPPETEERTPIP